MIWLRDPVEMFALNVDVPAGATTLDVDLDFLAPAPGANFTAGASTTPRLALLSWNTVLLYPRGVRQRLDSCSSRRCASPRAGNTRPRWKRAAATATRSTSSRLADHVIDSPVSSDRCCARSICQPLTPLRHTLNLLSDSADATVTPDDFATQYGQARR